MTAQATGAARVPLDAQGRSTLFLDARTANTFAGTPVSDQELSAIWELAKWPPTSANVEPLRVLYVRTQEGRERLVQHLAEGNRAKTLTAPAVAVLSLDPKYYEHIPALFPHKPEMRGYFEGNTEVGAFNATLQAGYFILAVRAAGLVAGPMTGFDAKSLDADFFPDGDRASFLVVNIGHPGENAWLERLPRLDDETVLDWA